MTDRLSKEIFGYVVDDEVPGAPGLRRRKLREPDALRALAHPVRLQLLEELGINGPATATELAERVSESQANCSWHLRQLHRFGFIEEVEGVKGRKRPWRYVLQSLSWDEGDDPPGSTVRLAGEAVRNVMIDREVAILKQWASAHQPDSPWRHAGGSSQSLMYLTLEELKALDAEVRDLVTRHLASRHERIDTERRPPGSRLVRFVSWVASAGPETEVPTPTEEDG